MTIDEILAPIVQDNLLMAEEAKVKMLREALEKLLDCDDLALHDKTALARNPHCDSCKRAAEARRVLKETAP